MKKWLLAILAVILLLELSSFSAFYQFGGSANVNGGSSMLVVAKEPYASARVEIQIWPESNSSLMPQVTFPNGTTRDLSAPLEFQVVLPGAFTPGSTYGGGYGYNITPQMPVNGSVVSVTGVPQGALSFSVPGIDFYTLTVSGQAAIWYRVWVIAL